MRSKDVILQHSLEFQPKTPQWDCTPSLHEHLTIEVLIDIRDLISSLTTILGSVEKIAYRAP